MALRQIQTLSRNNANVQLTNAVTDESNDKLIGNFRPPREIEIQTGEDTYTKITDIPAYFNLTSSTVNAYVLSADAYSEGPGGERRYGRGTSGIILTFETPVPNFFISAVALDQGQQYAGYYLGSVKAYDSDGIVIKGVSPGLPNTQAVVTIDGVERTVALFDNNLQQTPYDIKKANGRLIYQFSVENRTKLIKTVVLEPEGNRVWYQSIDWNRPLPPAPPPVINTTAGGTTVGGTVVGGGMTGLNVASGNYFGSQNFNSGYGGNHTHGLRPNPHDHDITPDPHTHNITPNPHRHGMRFESGSLGNGTWFDRTRDCPLGPDILIKLIYDELNTETAKEKSRVSEAAKKGNWITANKIGRPVWDYLERYYIHRIICYLRAHLWYTEYETLSIVPTDLTIVPRELIVEYGGYAGGQGTTGRSTVSAPPAPPPPPPPVYCVTPDDFNNPDVGNWTCKPYEAAEFSSTEICVFPGTIGFAQRCTEQDMYN